MKAHQQRLSTCQGIWKNKHLPGCTNWSHVFLPNILNCLNHPDIRRYQSPWQTVLKGSSSSLFFEAQIANRWLCSVTCGPKSESAEYWTSRRRTRRNSWYFQQSVYRCSLPKCRSIKTRQCYFPTETVVKLYVPCSFTCTAVKWLEICMKLGILQWKRRQGEEPPHWTWGSHPKVWILSQTVDGWNPAPVDTNW